MKKTAVEQAIELIKKDYKINGRLRPAYVFYILEQAKAMEKEQIYTTWVDGFYTDWRSSKMPSDYYDETFKSK